MMETIILADDHPVILNGISQFVASLGYKIISQYTNGIAAFNNVLALLPDYAILDIAMPGMSGLEVLEKIRCRNKTQKVILYTMYQDTALFEKAKSLDVNGFVLKDFALEELKECLEQLRYKKQWFSPRLGDSLSAKEAITDNEKLSTLSPAEQKIISLIALRKTSRQIGEQLFIAEKTVENHRSNIIKKLGLHGGSNALTFWAIEQAK